MLWPAAMHYATLFVVREDSAAAALALAASGAFAPDVCEIEGERLPELPGETFRERFHSARTRLEKLLAYCGLDLATLTPPAPRVVTEAELAALDDWLGTAWVECSRHQEHVRRCEEQTRHYEALLRSLDSFASLDIDLTLLKQGGRFLDVRVGSIPSMEVARLNSALALADYRLDTYYNEAGQSHCLIAGPRGHEAQIDPLLAAAGWRALAVPSEFQGRPEAVRVRLKAALAASASEHAQSCALLAGAQDLHRPRLIEAAHTLHCAAAHAELAPLLRARGALAAVSGWVPLKALPTLRRQLDATLPQRYLLTTRPPRADERAQVPTLTRHPRWLAPFAALVRNYGVPAYGEIDPTWLFAFSFVAMFGMMFGDIGHGAVIMLLGWVPALRFARPMFIAAGVSSMLFGWAYGSVFGYEHWVHPLWMSPMSDPMRMLTVALYWGIAFILLAVGLSIVNRLARGERQAALLDARGLAGGLFYLGLLLAVWHASQRRALGPEAWLLPALPFAVLLLHLWRHQRGSLAERLLVVAVEGFETVINYIANTLSFLRVAAFSLNHVALAIAVFALADLLEGPGHWIVVILGNLFILVLEGAIVAIQVLRLEYYEGFSRFFCGTGRAWRPLALCAAPPNPS